MWTVLFLVLAVNYANCDLSIVNIDSDNWKQIQTGEWLLFFTASWCPACRNFKESWPQLIDGLQDENIRIGSVEIDDSPDLTGRFLISTVPSIYHVKDNQFRYCRNFMDSKSLTSLIKEQKWKTITPVSFWISPSSHVMTLTALSFELANWFKNFHNYLTNEYGLHPYLSYVWLNGAIVVFVILLGLAIVFVIDYLSVKLMNNSSLIRGDGGNSDTSSGSFSYNQTSDSKSVSGSSAPLLPDEQIKDDLVDDSTVENKKQL